MKKMPISIVKSASLEWKLQVEIDPIEFKCAHALKHLIGSDPFFKPTDTCFYFDVNRMSFIDIKSHGIENSDSILDRMAKQHIARILDKYINDVGGYALVQA